MTDIKDVEQFLKEFFAKKSIWGVVFKDNRPKNIQLLADLGITKNMRNEIIDSLVAIDFSYILEEPGLWVFGKEVWKKEIYIKIELGLFGASTICVSFHVAERPMKYPFKERAKNNL